jgi:copper chaperone CopZ
MTCNGCAKHVDKALRAIPGVTAVEVSLPDKLAKVEHSDAAGVPAMIAAVESAGYSAEM